MRLELARIVLVPQSSLPWVIELLRGRPIEEVQSWRTCYSEVAAKEDQKETKSGRTAPRFGVVCLRDGDLARLCGGNDDCVGAAVATGLVVDRPDLAEVYVEGGASSLLEASNLGAGLGAQRPLLASARLVHTLASLALSAQAGLKDALDDFHTPQEH